MAASYLEKVLGRAPKKREQLDVVIDYTPTARQQVLHACTAEIALFGGAAGGGKSRGLLFDAFMTALANPGASVLLMRRTYPELERSLILESLKYFPQQICKYQDLKHRWLIRTSDKPSIFEFGYCDKEADVYKYKSAEFLYLGIDEASHFSEPMIRYLGSRVRNTVKGRRTKIRLASNPGHIGHSFLKNYFAIGKVENDVVWTPPATEDDPKPLSRAFLPAKLKDNPYLADNDPDYVKKLAGLPPAQRAMLMDGSWDVYVGRFFEFFDQERFVISASTMKAKIAPFWKIYRAIDYGFSVPFCCLWVASAPDGHFYVFREAYATGLRDEEQAELIVRMSRLDPPAEYTVGDPSMKATHGGESPQANYLRKEIAVFPGNNNRRFGWMAVRNLLADHPDGTPILKISETCPNLIRELDEAEADPKDTEDTNAKSDHAIDALRYFAATRPEQTKDADEDKFARMQRAEASEWRHVDKLQRRVGGEDEPAVLHGLNREDEGDALDILS